MKHYRLKVKEGKIVGCVDALNINRNSESHPELGLFCLRNKNGHIISIVCEANCKSWAYRVAMDFLDKV
jgi:hypothetical protein